MRKLLLGIILVGPGLLLLGIDGCSSSDSAPASVVPEAGTDAPTPVDAGPDVTTVDAGPDAAPIPAGDGGLLLLGGSFDALPLAVVDGTAYIADGGAAPMVASELRAYFSDRSTLCQSGVLRDNETIFAIDAQSGSLPFAAGTYTVKQQGGPGNVDVSITKLNAACGGSQDFGAASGTVVIESATASVITGTYDVTLLNDAGTLQGFFNVPVCNRPASATCQP